MEKAFIHQGTIDRVRVFHRSKEILPAKLDFIKAHKDFFNKATWGDRKEKKRIATLIREMFGYSSKTSDSDILCHFNRLHHLHGEYNTTTRRLSD